jgi:hypothetical protein
LNFVIYFALLISVENTVDRLKLIVNYQQLAFIFSRISAFVQDAHISLYKVKFLQAKKSHVQPQIRPLFVYFIGVAWRNTAK